MDCGAASEVEKVESGATRSTPRKTRYARSTQPQDASSPSWDTEPED